MCPFDATWEQVYANTQFGGGYPDTSLVRFVARNLYSRERKKTKILEVGCGVGANLWYLAREGFDVYGLDGSNHAIEKCCGRLKDQNLFCHLVTGDACALDFGDEFFDAVVDIECICTNVLSDIKKILTETYRVLKKNGLFFAMMFDRSTCGYGLGQEIESHTFSNIKSRIFEGRGIAHFFSEEEIRDLLQEAGFRDVEINSISRTENHKKHIIGELLCQAIK